jgi:hypothetical protein
MPTSSVSVTTPAANAANATGYMQADGFVTPVVLGTPIGTDGLHSKGPARFPFGSSMSSSIGLTAHAGGTQAAALLLPSQFNTITTVGTAADSVKLPLATANNVGYWVLVQNATATSMQVFGSGTDTINGVATATGVAIAANKFGWFQVTAAGTWVGMLALA